MNLKLIVFLLILIVPMLNAAPISPDYKISLSDNYAEFCAHTIKVMPITIINYANATNNYKIDIDGAPWSHINTNKLVIDSKSSKSFNLILTPDYTVSGTRIIKITIKPYFGNTEALIKILANVKDCNSSKQINSLEDINKTSFLQNIKDYFSNITFTSTGNTVKEVETNKSISTELIKVVHSVEKYQIPILIFLIIVMIILIIRKTGFNKKVLDFFEEEQLRKPKKKKRKKK